MFFRSDGSTTPMLCKRISYKHIYTKRAMTQQHPAAPCHSRTKSLTRVPAGGGIATLHCLTSARRAHAGGNAKSGGRIGGRMGFAANRKVKTITTKTSTKDLSRPLSAEAPPPPQFQMYTYVAPVTPHPAKYPVSSTLGSDGFFLLGCIWALYVTFLALWCWITPKR